MCLCARGTVASTNGEHPLDELAARDCRSPWPQRACEVRGGAVVAVGPAPPEKRGSRLSPESGAATSQRRTRSGHLAKVQIDFYGAAAVATRVGVPTRRTFPVAWATPQR